MTMKRLIVLISLIVTVTSQANNGGFLLNGPQLLGFNNNGGLNGGFNSGLNGGFNLNGGLNGNGLNSGLNGNGLNGGLNSGFSNGFNSGFSNSFSNGLNNLNNNNNGFLQNNNNAGLANNGNAGAMGMILGGNGFANANDNSNLQGLSSNAQPNSYPGLPNLPALPVFTDNLNYQQGQQAPLPVPQASALTTPTLGDYQQELPTRKSGFPLLAPGRLAPLPQVPQLPLVARPADLSLSRSLTANLRNDQSLSGPNLNSPLFPNGVPGGNNNNQNANNNNNNGFLSNNLLSLNNNNGLSNNSGFLNGNGLLNNNNGQAGDNLPLEVSQFSTQIVHNTPARAQAQQAKPNGLN